MNQSANETEGIMPTVLRSLEPLPQHLALTDWLFFQEKDVWQWYVKQEAAEENSEEIRLSLLRDTYRMEEEAHPEIFQQIHAACAALGFEGAVHVYQAQQHSEPNAAVCHLPGEAHVIFSGPILTLLSPLELRAVIGHELAHYQLWQKKEGTFLLADRILHASASHPAAQPAHAQSARVWRLATELFADRGAYLASGSLEATVAGLVKATTGLTQVSAKSYLAQANEIFSKSKPKLDQLTHPETFIRAHALKLWVEEDESLDEAIARMFDSDDGLDDLTLIQQSEMLLLTHRFIAHLLVPEWFQSDAILAHARHFFPEFTATADASIIEEISQRSAAHREYFAQIMLDFCAIDSDLHDQPIARCLSFAREMECVGVFEKLLVRELKVKSRDLKKLKEVSA